MKAYSEKADLVLQSLVYSNQLNWDKFTQATEIGKTDAILIFLRKKGLIDYSDHEITLTDKGKEFISRTSFVEGRNKSGAHSN